MDDKPLRILFVAAEMAPFIKTGGLADVIAGLPAALRDLGHDVRVLLPGYAAIKAPTRTPVASFIAPPGAPGARLSATRAPNGVAVWLLEAPGFSDRPGNPYVDAGGLPWPDDAVRFNLLCRTATRIAADACGLDWRPDVVHGHDWHAGLTHVWMMLERVPAVGIFTIHNLAYQGLFAHAALGALGLPEWLWHYRALEFHGRLACMKGGLVFADRLTTVSPTYAREIRRAQFGCGMEGVLTERAADLSGILNGIDVREWDPASDPALPSHFRRSNLRAKRLVKRHVLKEFGLPLAPEFPLLAFVGRLVAQKGVDVMLDALPALLDLPLRVVALGSGQPAFERALAGLAAAHPERLGVRLGYDEALAHRLYAGADILLMPSRFEPCGLAQLYAMRYGTVPVVHRTGGLADTVIDADDERGKGVANGFAFAPLTAAALGDAVRRALRLHADDPRRWRDLVRAGMRRDDSWAVSARSYARLYREALARRSGAPARTAAACGR